MFDLLWYPGTVCCLSNYSLYFFKYMVSNSFLNPLLRFLSMIQMFLRYDCNSRRSSLTTLLNLTWLISLSSLGLSSLEILFFKYFGLSFVDFLIVSNDPKIPGNIILRLQRIRSTMSTIFHPFTSSCISYKNYGRMSKKLTYHFSSRPPLNFSSLFLLYPEEAWLLYFVIQFVCESIRQSRVFQYTLLYIYFGSYTRLSCNLIK